MANNKINPVNFTKSDRRILIDKLEKLYGHTLFNRQFYLTHCAPEARKTNVSNVDRRYRIELKSCEIVLHKLGSKLMTNVKNPSIRRTLEITVGNDRTIQG
jgi:hypothetical protein